MKKLEKGFTLIELMIVVAIIAILAAVAAPRFGQQLAKTRDAKAIQIVGNWRSALNMAYADTQTYATTFSALNTYVDTNTRAKTYQDSAKAVYTGANATQWTDAGTVSSRTPSNVVSFVITGTSIESSIVFEAGNGNDTKGTSWSAY